MEHAISDARAELQSLEEELKNWNLQYNKLEHQHTEQKKNWNMCKRELQKNEKEMDDAQKEIDDIKAEESTAVDMDADTSTEEQEVAEAQEMLDTIKENQIKLKEQIEENKPTIQDLKDRVSEVSERNKKVLADLEKAQNDLSQYFNEMEMAKQKVEKKRQKLEQYEKIILKHSETVSEAEQEVKEYLFLAKKVHYNYNALEERRVQREENEGAASDTQFTEYSQEPTSEELDQIDIPNLESIHQPDHYKARVERAEAKIALEKERRRVTRDDLATAYDKYVRAKEILQAKESQIQEIEEKSEAMKGDLKLRKRRWMEFRAAMSVISNLKFDETLNIKGSSGQIKFDHVNGTLDLIVQKDSNIENSQQKDVKALSGGERSFTTISLLLAIGEMLETPFRVMDEFDVFLDPVTRKLIIDTLIAVGEGMPHRQFIFITPQDVSNVESSPTLKILKMKPPERRQVAGGHTQQTLEFSQQ